MKINNINNVFGIKNMTSGTDELGNSCIYASNGIFKTSFARFMFYLSRQEFSSIVERVRNKEPKFDIEINGVKITQEINDKTITEEQKLELSNIVVFSNDIYNERTLDDTSKIVTRNRFKKVAGNETLQLEIAKIKENLENYKIKIIESIKSGLTEKQGTKLLDHYLKQMKISKIDINALLMICESAIDVGEIDISFVPWKDLGSTAYRNIIDTDEFHNKAKDYLEILNREIISDVFDETFNDINVESFLETIKTTSFLSENRKIYINGNFYEDYKKLEQFLKEKTEEIKMKPSVRKSFDEMIKLLGSSQPSREIKTFLNDTNKVKTLITKTKGMISSKIYQSLKREGIEEIYEQLKKLNDELKEIKIKTNSVKSDYEKAIEIFNDRFQPPFNSFIKNREDSILGLELPMIEFYHRDNIENIMNEKNLSKILSSGELSSLKIIHLIVECEALKDRKPLIIIDDIVQTFDYANRVATVEYLQDLSRIGGRIILLTHNFDFFRFSYSRLRIFEKDGITKKFKRIYGHKGSRNNIVLSENALKEFNLKQMRKIDDIKAFLSIIPLAREIIDIRNDESLIKNNHLCDDFYTLTYALHYDEQGISIKVRDIIEVIKKHIPIECKIDEHLDTNYYDFILENDFNIQGDIDLKGKLASSIKIRILLDMYMLGYKKDHFDALDFSVSGSGSSNQTRVLYEHNKHLFTDNGLKIIEKALLITPEYIHFNAFMYEPLIDVTKKELSDLYDDVVNLESIYIE